MSKSIRVVGACLLLCGLLVAGCGGDDDSSGGEGTATGAEAGNGQGESADGGALETTSESKEEYVATANALCKERLKQLKTDIGKVFKEAQDAEGEEQEDALRRLVVDVVAPGMETEAEELRELGTPKGSEEQVEAIVVAVEGVAAEARKDPKAFLTDVSVFEDAQRRARRYGISQCGRAS